jgi:hypothetical protein
VISFYVYWAISYMSVHVSELFKFDRAPFIDERRGQHSNHDDSNITFAIWLNVSSTKGSLGNKQLDDNCI